jgi:hypothetical protein
MVCKCEEYHVGDHCDYLFSRVKTKNMVEAGSKYYTPNFGHLGDLLSKNEAVFLIVTYHDSRQ